MKTIAIIAAAGCGKRMGQDKNKLLLKFGNKTVLELAVQKFIDSTVIDGIVIAAAKQDKPYIEKCFCGLSKPITITEGGLSRTESVKKALAVVDKDCDIVLIHDGARPFISLEIISNCVKNIKLYGSSVTAVPVADTLKRADENMRVSGSEDRNGLYSVQTPQGFYYKDIVKAYSMADDAESFTDDSSVYEKYIAKPYIGRGESTNIKITYADDLKFMEKANVYRTGTGFDCHRFSPDRKLILGGVEIPFEKGLMGHSDADALVHAIIDSLFSAAALPDIGTHFPDTDPRYKGVCSMLLLKECKNILVQKGFGVNNISAVLICKAPKLAPYISAMKENIASLLDISPNKIGISAKTTEGMLTDEGIFATASCSLVEL